MSRGLKTISLLPEMCILKTPKAVVGSSAHHKWQLSGFLTGMELWILIFCTFLRLTKNRSHISTHTVAFSTFLLTPRLLGSYCRKEGSPSFLTDRGQTQSIDNFGPAAAPCVDAHTTRLATGQSAGRQDCVCLEIAADLLETETREGKQTTECLSILLAASPSSRTMPAAQQEDALKSVS